MVKTAAVAVAFDTFKNCVDGYAASRYVAWRLRRAGHAAVALPLADGGEGTADTLLRLKGGRRISVPTVDAYGAEIEAAVALLADGSAAVDFAAAGGLTERRDVMSASSYGVGLLLRRLARLQPLSRIYLGLGGSATCDGGIGLMAALTGRGPHLPLPTLADMPAQAPSTLPFPVPLTVLRDVDAPLTGPDGAARFYAPQKGATEEQTDRLEQMLTRWSRITGVNPQTPGMGAAGGVSVALSLLPEVEFRCGADYILQLLSPTLAQAGLVITGEGRTDAQTLQGKAPFALLGHVQQLSPSPPPVILLSGALGIDASRLLAAGFSAAEAVTPTSPSSEDLTARRTLPRLAAAALRFVNLSLARGSQPSARNGC